LDHRHVEFDLPASAVKLGAQPGIGVLFDDEALHLIALGRGRGEFCFYLEIAIGRSLHDPGHEVAVGPAIVRRPGWHGELQMGLASASARRGDGAVAQGIHKRPECRIEAAGVEIVRC
jgi:hypothetical protein